MNSRRDKGTILIITLWILAILAILSVGVAGRMGLELKLTGLYRDNMTALYLAKAGIERAIAIVGTRDKNVNSLTDDWTNNNEDAAPLFKEIVVSNLGAFTVSYPFEEEKIFYGVQDEERRININTMPKEAIERLLRYLEVTEPDPAILAASIEDWRDEGATREDGSPEDDYSAEGYPRKDNFFDVGEELLLVKGMTPEIFNKIKDCTTVYPKTSAKLNVNTASLPALYALGLSVDKSQDLIATRAGDDGIEGTDDDKPFTDPTAFQLFLSSEPKEILPDKSAGLPDFKSSYFRIVSYGETNNKRGHKTVTCVIGPPEAEQKDQVLFWDER
jgi:type II secretory pathway component PulK